MRLFKLETRQVVPISLADAWDFFSNAANLAEITPPDMAFEVISELPPRVYPGLIVTYRVRPLLGIPVSWVTEITHVREPTMFVDEQRFGPYRFWHHQHHFREVDGGVELHDLVHYSPPGLGRRLIDRWLVGPRLRGIFEFRRQVLQERFGRVG